MLTTAEPVTRDNWTAFSSALFCDLDSPVYPKVWMVQIASYLYRKGYTLEWVRAVLEHASEHGSVECPSVEFARPEHRAAVERLIPLATSKQWARHDGFVWATTNA